MCTASCRALLNFDEIVRGLYPLESRPGLISLLAGKPNATTFPLTSIQLTSRSPADPSQEIKTEIDSVTLAEGLQYGPTAGLPCLIDWVYGLQEQVHGRKKGEGWRVSIGSGSQDVIYKVCPQTVTNKWPVAQCTFFGTGCHRYSQFGRTCARRISGLCVSTVAPYTRT